MCPKFYKRVRYERGKDREVFTTSGPYPWSFVTQIFHKGQPSHGVEAEITVTKVFITANMKNSKSHCKQEVDVR